MADDFVGPLQPEPNVNAAEGGGGFFDGFNFGTLFDAGVGIFNAKQQADASEASAKLEAKSAAKLAKLGALQAFAEAQSAQAGAAQAAALAAASKNKPGKVSPAMIGVAAAGLLLVVMLAK